MMSVQYSSTQQMGLLFFCLLWALLWSRSMCACPTDTAKRAQQCFTDLAKGVATFDNTNNHINGGTSDYAPGLFGGSYDGRDLQEKSGSKSKSQTTGGAMPMDYRKIREFCAEDGQMPRFVRCVEELSSQCPDLPPEGALKQLINPQRVRTSVPNLCAKVDEVEAGSECMNDEMNKVTPCKVRAYDVINTGMAAAASNTTAMFYVQCRFFSVLAQCQRSAVTQACGGDLGDLHADFLLSFVPDRCASDPTSANDLLQGQGQTNVLGQGQTETNDLENESVNSPDAKLRKDAQMVGNSSTDSSEAKNDDFRENRSEVDPTKKSLPKPVNKFNTDGAATRPSAVSEKKYGGGDKAHAEEEVFSQTKLTTSTSTPQTTTTTPVAMTTPAPRAHGFDEQVLKTLPSSRTSSHPDVTSSASESIPATPPVEHNLIDKEPQAARKATSKSLNSSSGSAQAAILSRSSDKSDAPYTDGRRLCLLVLVLVVASLALL